MRFVEVSWQQERMLLPINSDRLIRGFSSFTNLFGILEEEREESRRRRRRKKKKKDIK